jgi:putative ABC transport system ATP-binding protein
LIELKNVSKVYGKKQNVFTALNDVTISIPEGTTVAIVGKSGSGKSTLMHVLSGLDKATSGEITIGGKDIISLKSKALDNFRANEMSFIFQSFFVEANQTCYQNVMLPLEIAKVPASMRKKMALDALSAVELAEKKDVKARNLSGGQKQRLAVARSIINSPKLIFADEPTGNLDSATGEKIMGLLFDLNKKMGSTLIIVTHDHELASRCNMQIMIKDGHITDIRKSLKTTVSKHARRVE